LVDLCETMKDGSLCALGGFTPYPVMSALRPVPRGIRADAGGGGMSRFSARRTGGKSADFPDEKLQFFGCVFLER
jgi:hypothetical protein